MYALWGAMKLHALFNQKTRLAVRGREEWRKRLQEKINALPAGGKRVWFHASSLGEFEQGRPVMESLKKSHPDVKIILTFFSPSGYEVRKNYDGADIVCYLPIDTPANAKKFIDLVNPCMVFFVKYEFWQNYLNTLYKKGIPVYSVSSIFRPNQIFFRWYGKGYQQVLKTFAHLFVQNEESKQLLAGIGVNNTTVVGDTRFDRVLDICAAAKQLPLVQKFKGDALTFVAGSSWGPDEDIFIKYFNAHPEMKLIIAPHVVNDSHLKEIESKLQRSSIRYTKATEDNVQQADCLIIDCYGLLSSIYRYGEISYIGGGFGVGIHNVLEAAVYGIPVIFGPNNKKFREAQHLLANKGGFEIHGYDDFEQLMNKFLTDEAYLQASGQAAGDYVKNNSGAMEKIMDYVKL